MFVLSSVLIERAARALLFLCVAASCLTQLAAGPRGAGDLIYPRIFITCKLAGGGAASDPIRPVFAYSPAQIAAAVQAGTPLPPLLYRMEVGDDGKTAIVMFSSPSPVALGAVRAAVAATTDGSAQLYDTDALPYGTLEQQLQQVKASFKLYRFLGAPAPPPSAATTAPVN